MVAAVRSYMYVLGSAVPPTKGHVSTHRADTDMSDEEDYGGTDEEYEHGPFHHRHHREEEEGEEELSDFEDDKSYQGTSGALAHLSSRAQRAP